MMTNFARKVCIAVMPRSFLLRTRLQNGAVVAGYNRPGYGGRGVYLWRDSLEPELAALSRFVGPGMCFVDVGANVGVYSIKAAREVGERGLVIAIEPFIESACQLAANVRANAFENVRLRNCCVGSRTGDARLYLNERKPNSFSLCKVGHAKSVSVFCVTLDDLCRWESIDRLDYLKIDAEGAEELILEGAREAIKRFRPVIQIEVTLNSAAAPERYRRFSAANSPNNVLVPVENEYALLNATRLGWIER